jgi:Rod binding domain-containing protein
MEVSNILNLPSGVARHDDKNNNVEIAKKLEIAFISEMLSFVGMKEATDGFGGGIGESQFQSFLREQHAKLIVEKGGLGLAEHFANSLREI